MNALVWNVRSMNRRGVQILHGVRFESMVRTRSRQIGSGACIAVASSEMTVCLPIGNGSHSQEISFCVAVGLEPGL